MKACCLRGLSLLLSLALLLGVLAGCNGKTGSPIQINGKTQYVDSVLTFAYTDESTGETQEYSVSLDEYRFYFLSLKAQMDGGDDSLWDTDTDGTYQAMLKQQVYTYIVTTYASLTLAQRYSLRLTADEQATVSSQYAATVESYGNESTLLEALRDTGYMTKEVYLAQLEQYLLQSKVYDYLFGEGGPMAVSGSTEELAAFVAENFVRAQHVLVEDAETANTVLAMAYSGADFNTLMEEYNTDEAEEADGYVFCRGEMVSAFEEAAFALGEGGISDIVQSDYGYHVIKRLELTDDYIQENLEDMVSEYEAAQYNLLLDSVANAFTVTYNEFYSQLNISNMVME